MYIVNFTRIIEKKNWAGALERGPRGRKEASERERGRERGREREREEVPKDERDIARDRCREGSYGRWGNRRGSCH